MKIVIEEDYKYFSGACRTITIEMSIILPPLSICRMSLFNTWLKNTTMEQALTVMALPSKTSTPSVKEFLIHLFKANKNRFAEDEKNLNVCVICYMSINRKKRIENCESCGKNDIHDECLKSYVKASRDTRCPNCRHDMGNRYRPNIRNIFRNGITFMWTEQLHDIVLVAEIERDLVEPQIWENRYRDFLDTWLPRTNPRLEQLAGTYVERENPNTDPIIDRGTL